MLVYNPSFVGQAESELYDSTRLTGKSELDKEDFLTLLVAQLANQDPLNPMENTDFTSQLAEFSSLEQLTNISGGIDSLAEGSARQDLMSAVDFIGKDVRAEGESLSIEDGEISSMYFSLGEAATEVHINIFDENGNILRTEQLGSRAAGEHEYQWDGRNWAGEELPDGVYYVSMAAENSDGQPILTWTEVSGEVAGVQTYGTDIYLRLTDGRVVAFSNVTEVVNPGESAGGGEEE
ncbi:MAG: flagellar hook assembly protein FlgD [Thermodesulfobacteriota bacterium]|nr:flagellar hook assembly protein FlgD [Thermodesulfobacteriota bacterium]